MNTIALAFLFRAAHLVAATLLLGVGAHGAVQTGLRMPGNSTEWVGIKKLLVTDCRAVRGFLGTPVDGTVKSWDYRGVPREYPNTASDGVAYSFNRNAGVHFTLADEAGFDAVVLRGGAKTKLYRDTGSLTESPGASPLHAFAGGQPTQGVWFTNRIQESRTVLFGSEGGTVAEVSFYRIERRSKPPAEVESWHVGEPMTLSPPASKFDVASLHRGPSQCADWRVWRTRGRRLGHVSTVRGPGIF